jgi:5-methyltetrahydrofolate--homocysteine methyltransferase
VDPTNRISEALQRGDHLEVAALTQRAVDDGLAAATILNDGLLAGMDVVGRRFGAHEIFLPEVLLAARAMTAGVDVIKPLLIAGEVPSRGRVVIGTVKGDLHDIGKNLVGIMLEGAGFEVIDLGTDVPPGAFVDRAEAENADIIGLSALLTTTMANMRTVVETLRSRGLEERIRVVVGGAPVTPEFAEDIGAHAYGHSSHDAVAVVKRLTGG